MLLKAIIQGAPEKRLQSAQVFFHIHVLDAVIQDARLASIQYDFSGDHAVTLLEQTALLSVFKNMILTRYDLGAVLDLIGFAGSGLR